MNTFFYSSATVMRIWLENILHLYENVSQKPSKIAFIFFNAVFIIIIKIYL